jgi:uncharacterized membrane protein YhaH (DUF805 family)
MAEATPVDWAKRPLEKYADFSGRAPRAEFWWYVLGVIVVALVAKMIESLVGLGAVFLAYGPLTLLIALATFIPSLAVQVRRLHDLNRSGLWLLVFYIPYALMLFMMPAAPAPGSMPDLGSAAIAGLLGLVVLVIGIALIIFFCLPGTKGDNNFGSDPYAGDSGAAATV